MGAHSCCSTAHLAKFAPTLEGKAIDPICGMTVAIGGARFVADHDGATHYFCSQGCHDKFVGDPEFYLSGAHLYAPASRWSRATCRASPRRPR